MIDPDDLATRFTYHAPKDGQADLYQQIRFAVHGVATMINENAPDSREKSLAMTHLEDAVMWTNAAIARHG